MIDLTFKKGAPFLVGGVSFGWDNRPSLRDVPEVLEDHQNVRIYMAAVRLVRPILTCPRKDEIDDLGTWGWAGGANGWRLERWLGSFVVNGEVFFGDLDPRKIAVRILDDGTPVEPQRLEG